MFRLNKRTPSLRLHFSLVKVLFRGTDSESLEGEILEGEILEGEHLEGETLDDRVSRHDCIHNNDCNPVNIHVGMYRGRFSDSESLEGVR